MDSEWYRANIMKPTDMDTFGNEGTLYPSDKFIIFVSLSQEASFEDIKWLAGCEDQFRGLTIS